MTREQILEQLQSIFRDLFDDAGITVEDSTTAADVEGWDSLAHMQLVSMVEEHFNIHFNLGEITGFANVGEMVQSIIKHLGK